jgi:hypothetical protein
MTTMVGGHRQQSTKRVLEEMMVGNSDGDEYSDCDRNSKVTAFIMMPMQMLSTADAELMVVCVVFVLCVAGKSSPGKQKCPPLSH